MYSSSPSNSNSNNGSDDNNNGNTCNRSRRASDSDDDDETERVVIMMPQLQRLELHKFHNQLRPWCEYTICSSDDAKQKALMASLFGNDDEDADEGLNHAARTCTSEWAAAQHERLEDGRIEPTTEPNTSLYYALLPPPLPYSLDRALHAVDLTVMVSLMFNFVHVCAPRLDDLEMDGDNQYYGDFMARLQQRITRAATAASLASSTRGRSIHFRL
jgi:hypothetical protein